MNDDCRTCSTEADELEDDRWACASDLILGPQAAEEPVQDRIPQLHQHDRHAAIETRVVSVKALDKTM